jgi:hypothetical protein
MKRYKNRAYIAYALFTFAWLPVLPASKAFAGHPAAGRMLFGIHNRGGLRRASVPHHGRWKYSNWLGCTLFEYATPALIPRLALERWYSTTETITRPLALRRFCLTPPAYIIRPIGTGALLYNGTGGADCGQLLYLFRLNREAACLDQLQPTLSTENPKDFLQTEVSPQKPPIQMSTFTV